jgi:5'-nucleotidase
MNLLLTNDDGFDSPALLALIPALQSLGTLYLAAPLREQSGSSHSISAFDPIRVKPRVTGGARAAWSIDGTPVDCVKLALTALIPEPVDLVISGINLGPNLGNDVFYSGTVAAAAEAAIMGKRALAVSLMNFDRTADFVPAAQATQTVAAALLSLTAADPLLWNVNFPAAVSPRTEFRLARQGRQLYHNVFEERRDPRGNAYYWLGGRVVDEEADADTDLALLRRGYTVITPLRLNWTERDWMQTAGAEFIRQFN